MKCPSCSFNNIRNSIFCQECGYNLHTEKPIKNNISRLIREKENEIEDILFIPKNKQNPVWGYVITVFLAIIVLLIIFLFIKYSNNNISYTDTNYTITPTPSFNISCLSLNGTKMNGNTYYVPNPTFEGTLYNGCSQAVKDVVMKVNFYKYGANGEDIPLDTQYINLADYLAPQDSKRVKGTINTEVNTAGPFSWTSNVYSAEPY